mgnify:CR=1 FL=1
MGVSDSLQVDRVSYRFSPTILDQVMSRTQLKDAQEVVSQAALFDDGNHYLNAGELKRAAAAIQRGLPKGYRFSSNIVSDVMKRYGLTDTVALMRGAIARKEGGRYLNRNDLM